MTPHPPPNTPLATAVCLLVLCACGTSGSTGPGSPTDAGGGPASGGESSGGSGGESASGGSESSPPGGRGGATALPKVAALPPPWLRDDITPEEQAAWDAKRAEPLMFWEDDTPIPYPGKHPMRAKMGKPAPDGAFKMPGYSVWCPSIIKVGDTYHMFASRWIPTANATQPASGDPADSDTPQVMKGWQSGHVVRATSEALEGPYEFQEVALAPRTDRLDVYDSRGVQNPKITKMGDTFVLYYIMIPHSESAFPPWPVEDQAGLQANGYRMGVATSQSITGPWQRTDMPVAPFNNPALHIHDDGSVVAVSKHKKLRAPSGRSYVRMLSYRANDLMGPYQLLNDGVNALPNGYELEDPAMWFANGRYNIVLNDWREFSFLPGKALMHYFSEDGVRYHLYSDQPFFHEVDPLEFSDGTAVEFWRVERPNVYVNEAGEVEALMAAAAQNATTHPMIVVWPVDRFVP